MEVLPTNWGEVFFYNVGIFLTNNSRCDTLECLLFAMQDLFRIFPDCEWQINIICKMKWFERLEGQVDFNFYRHKRASRLKHELLSIWWDVQFLITHHLHYYITACKPAQCYQILRLMNLYNKSMISIVDHGWYFCPT